jgi:hypothetical protein
MRSPASGLHWRTKVLLYLGLGLAYAVPNAFSGRLYLPGCDFAELRPQIAMPLFAGLYWGPVAGFVCGMLGDAGGYLLSGKGLMFAPHWSLANGLAGLIPGCACLLGLRRIESSRQLVRLLGLLLAACSLPFLGSTLTEFAMGRVSFHSALYELFLPIWITDSLWAFLLIPLFLWAARLLVVRLEMRNVLMVYYLVLGAVLATWISGLYVRLDRTVDVTELYNLGAVGLIVLLFALVLAAWSARRTVAPVTSLTSLARRVADGDYGQVESLDRLGQESLKHEVSQLQIEIDRQKQQRELRRITGSDYFQALKRKAQDLRDRNSDD